MNSQLYAGDPLTNWMRGKLRWSPGKATITIFLLLNIPVIILASVYNLWETSNGTTGLLQDLAWWGYQFTGVPATLYFFFWMPDGILDVLNGLKINKVIQLHRQANNDEDKYQQFINRFAKVYSSRKWVILAFCCVTLAMVFAVIPEQRNFVSWQTANNVVFWYHEFFWYVSFLIGGVALIKVLLTLYWFNRIFVEFKVDIRVLHPDMAGGLSPLGNFSVKIGYMIGIFGFTSVMVIWSQSAYLVKNGSLSLAITPAIISSIFVYLMLAPIVFFAPIGSAHSAMKRARHDFIIAISDQFENDFEKIQLLLDKDSDELKKVLDKIEHLQQVHNMAARFPVWPFNTASLIRFFSSVFLPVVVGIIPSIIIQLIK
jgi:hypothetical protein